jgi:sec-independent protein translocase protein TatA
VGALQPGHLVVILAIVLIMFGPGKLGDVSAQLGRGIRELRDGADGSSARPIAAGSRYCSQCGTSAAADASFCTGCGRALGQGG